MVGNILWLIVFNVPNAKIRSQYWHLLIIKLENISTTITPLDCVCVHGLQSQNCLDTDVSTH